MSSSQSVFQNLLDCRIYFITPINILKSMLGNPELELSWKIFLREKDLEEKYESSMVQNHLPYNLQELLVLKKILITGLYLCAMKS